MIVYVDMDDVLADFSRAYHNYRGTHPHIAFPQSIPGFFEGLQPIEGAIDSVNRLRASGTFEVYILTAPSTRNPLSYTEKRLWIEQHFDYEFTKQLIICSNKGLLKGNYLIDDNIDGKGQERFEGRVIHFGSDRYPTWPVVMNEFQAF
jgi:5'(3')-deoxyribonucleotidase